MTAHPGGEVDYGSGMRLPPQMMCAHCKHIRRCLGLGFTEATNTSCDFYPSKFQAKPHTEAGRAGK